jgi:hypothetical protein
MASFVDKVDPRNINWQKSPHKVTAKVMKKNDDVINKLDTEQKLLSHRLNKGVYKTLGDHKKAWEAQNRSFQRVIDYRDKWDEVSSSHPLVNKQREKEKDRFMDEAIAIQKKYDGIISKHAQQKGLCGYLSKETCRKGKNCYWFGKENVAGKDVGCYSTIEETIPFGQKQILKRSKKPKDRHGQALPTLGEEDEEDDGGEEKKQQSTVGTKGVNKGGRKTRKKRRKRKTKRRKQKRKTKRKRRKRKTRKKKKQKGGSCYNNTNCFFIKGHGKSNRKSFVVPANIEINFYAPKGQLAPAFYNDIRDACYDIDLKEGGPCERVTSGNMCPDYRITNFKGEKQTSESSFYAAPNAGLYNCPPFYQNAPTGYKESQLIAPILDNGTTLSEIVMYVSKEKHGTNNVINCNFCRGTKGSYANQFFNSIPQDIPGTPGGTGATGRFSQQYNQNMRNQYQTNMNQQQGMDLDD